MIHPPSQTKTSQIITRASRRIKTANKIKKAASKIKKARTRIVPIHKALNLARIKTPRMESRISQIRVVKLPAGKRGRRISPRSPVKKRAVIKLRVITLSMADLQDDRDNQDPMITLSMAKVVRKNNPR
jgi:hypothetical protein